MALASLDGVMLPFRHTVPANDATIKHYVMIASRLGVEDANWTYEWKDGNRAAFAFDTEERRKLFAFEVWWDEIITR